MKTKNDVPNIELHSEEVQELMGKTPPTILRVGISIILCFILFIFTASYFVKIQNKITLPITAKNVDFISEVKVAESGRIFHLKEEYNTVNKGDTLAKIINKIDTIEILSPITGFVYACNTFQNNDFVNKDETLFFIVDSIKGKIKARTSLPIKLREKVKVGSPAESEINGIQLEGQVTSIAQYAKPDNGMYMMDITFNTPLELTKTIVWNVKTTVKIKSDAQNIITKFIWPSNHLQ